MLGLDKGDVVLARVSLRKLGNVEGNRAEVFIRALLEVVGPEGTIAALAFTRFFRSPGKYKDYIFDLTTPPYTGGFAAALVNWPGALRSPHPTNSWVAFGKSANVLLAGHDETASCFFPIKRLMDLGGKLILVGCVADSPGFSTVHYAQEQQGLSGRNIHAGRQGVYFRKNSEVRLFKRKDIPGCSKGFHNFYGYYVSEGILNVAYVGDAYSIAASARDIYKIEYNLLKQNPKIALCDDPYCFHCRGSLLYNLSDFILFYLRLARLYLIKAVRMLKP